MFSQHFVPLFKERLKKNKEKEREEGGGHDDLLFLLACLIPIFFSLPNLPIIKTQTLQATSPSLSTPPLFFSVYIPLSYVFLYFFIAGYLPSLEHWKPQNLIVIPLSRYLLPSSPIFLLHFLPVIVWFAGARSLEQVGSMFWWSIMHSGHWSRAFGGYIRKKISPISYDIDMEGYL